MSPYTKLYLNAFHKGIQKRAISLPDFIKNPLRKLRDYQPLLTENLQTTANALASGSGATLGGLGGGLVGGVAGTIGGWADTAEPTEEEKAQGKEKTNWFLRGLLGGAKGTAIGGALGAAGGGAAGYLLGGKPLGEVLREMDKSTDYTPGTFGPKGFPTEGQNFGENVNQAATRLIQAGVTSGGIGAAKNMSIGDYGSLTHLLLKTWKDAGFPIDEAGSQAVVQNLAAKAKGVSADSVLPWDLLPKTPHLPGSDYMREQLHSAAKGVDISTLPISDEAKAMLGIVGNLPSELREGLSAGLGRATQGFRRGAAKGMEGELRWMTPEPVQRVYDAGSGVARKIKEMFGG